MVEVETTAKPEYPKGTSISPTFFSNGVLVEQYTVGGDDKVFTSFVIKRPTGLKPENIAYGVTIFGVKGTAVINVQIIDKPPVIPDEPETPCEHNYVNGVCQYCGAADPNYIPPTTSGDKVYAVYSTSKTLTDNAAAVGKLNSWAAANSLTLNFTTPKSSYVFICIPESWNIDSIGDGIGEMLGDDILSRTYRVTIDGQSCKVYGTAAMLRANTYTLSVKMK
jgi:hypothetical protein